MKKMIRRLSFRNIAGVVAVSVGLLMLVGGIGHLFGLIIFSVGSYALMMNNRTGRRRLTSSDQLDLAARRAVTMRMFGWE